MVNNPQAVYQTCLKWHNPNHRSSFTLKYLPYLGFPGGSEGKESTCNVGDPCLIPVLGRSPGGGHGNPLQYSCLENLVDREPLCRQSTVAMQKNCPCRNPCELLSPLRPPFYRHLWANQWSGKLLLSRKSSRFLHKLLGVGREAFQVEGTPSAKTLEILLQLTQADFKSPAVLPSALQQRSSFTDKATLHH